VGKIGSLVFAEGLALRVGAKANVPMRAGRKLFLKNVGGKKIKKQRVGKECRLTRCPLEIWSVCCSPVKMVCPCINVQFIVVCSMVALSSYTCR